MRWKSASRPLFLPYCSPLVHLTRQRELIHQEGRDQLHGAGALSARKVSTDVPPSRLQPQCESLTIAKSGPSTFRSEMSLETVASEQDNSSWLPGI